MSEPIILPTIPEPELTDEERETLSELFSRDTFWEWFEQQPEPPD